MKLPPRTTAITPHLTVRDVEKAAHFYRDALGFRIKLLLPGGRTKQIRHGEVEREGCTVMLGPESPERRMLAPISSGAVPPVSLYLYVEDVDAAHARAVDGGAIELLAPSDQFFGARTSVVTDPDGHQWMLSQHQKDMTEGEMREKLQAGPEGAGRAHSGSAPPGSAPSGRRPFKTR